MTVIIFLGTAIPLRALAQSSPEEKFFILPLAGYSSEFGLGFGGTAAWLNIDKTNWQASSAAYVGTLYSLNFINVDLLNRHWLDFLYADVGGSYYQNYRTFFYGLGNNSNFNSEVQFSNLREQSYAKLGIRLFKYLVIGGSVSQGTMSIDRGADPSLPQFLDQYGNLPYASGVTSTFLGEFFSYDSRIPETAPQQGNQLFVLWETSQPGISDHLNEQHLEVIAENLWPMFDKKLVMVTHSKFERTWGTNVPFFLAAPIGGMDTLRGFDVSRFIGTGALTFDLEPRWTIWAPNGAWIKRFEVSAAFEAGQVFDSGLLPPAQGYHIDDDFGFAVVMKGDLPLRFDIGISDEATLLYVNLFYPF